MKFTVVLGVVLGLAMGAGAGGCSDKERPDDGGERAFSAPVSLSPEGTIPSSERNPLSAAGAALGRKLFFDPRLSGSNLISCATCHDPAAAYSDGRPRSIGAAGTPLRRHTPALANLAWMDGYFWDGGAKNLESQVFGPLTSPEEMAQNPRELLAELAADDEYPALFARAFPDGITLANVVRALAQFERTLLAADSRYDRYVRGEAGGVLSAEERFGLALFGRHCGRCHVPDFFTDHGYHNNGLDDVFSEEHERLAWGRGRITHDPADIGKYKTPSLRNVAVTAPYMHDGRLETLEAVLDHYRVGMRVSPTLDPGLMQTGVAGRPGISLSDEEARAIIAFLHTLTDAAYVPRQR